MYIEFILYFLVVIWCWLFHAVLHQYLEIKDSFLSLAVITTSNKESVKHTVSKRSQRQLHPLWNLLDDKQVVLSTWIICWKFTCRNIPLNFPQNSRLKWEGNFPKPLNLPIHQRIDTKNHWDIFSQLEPFVWPIIALRNFQGNMRETSMRKYPWWFSREKRGK